MITEIVKNDFAEWLDDPAMDIEGNVLDSSIWTLKTAIRGVGAGVVLTGSANGAGWKTSISMSQSNGLTAGTYYFTVYAQNDPTTPTKRITLTQGRLTVKPDIAATNADYDGRSQTRKDLEAVQAAIRGVATANVQEYMIGNRSIKRIPLTELIALESKFKAEVIREQKADMIKEGLGNPHQMLVRFK
jgi:hypothetical protein